MALLSSDHLKCDVSDLATEEATPEQPFCEPGGVLFKLTTVPELTTVFEGPWLLSSKDPVEDSSVDHSTIQAKVVVE